jgi:uncharacterized protein YsxB (DUF464 family)
MSGRKSRVTIESVCLNCNTVVKDRVPRKYCNKSCAAKVNGVLFPKRSKQEKHCTACGIPFKPRRSENTRCSPCSPSLYTQATKGNSTEQNIRGHARRQMRNQERVCAVCSYDIYVEVCHIRSIKAFTPESSLQEINALTNLTFLCPNHHKEYDLGLLTLQQ